MQRVVSDCLLLCEDGLREQQDKAPKTVTNSDRLRDMAAMLLCGAWFYSAWDLGPDAAGEAAGSLW